MPSNTLGAGSSLFVAALLVSSVAAANFCRDQNDFNPSAIATGSTTCSALSSYLLGKVSGSPSTWSAVSCSQVWSTSWQDGGSGSEIKSVAEHLWAFGTACCGSAYKTQLGTTCYGCANVGGAGLTVDVMGWYSAAGSTTWQVASPGAGIKTGAGTGLGPGSFCAVTPTGTYDQTNQAGVTCNIASWTNKKHGDASTDAAYSTCGKCTVLISKTTPSTYSTCDAYCAAQQGGLVCAGAWDEILDSCQKKLVDGSSPLTCASTYTHSHSDIMCQCCPASGCPIGTVISDADAAAFSTGLIIVFVVVPILIIVCIILICVCCCGAACYGCAKAAEQPAPAPAAAVGAPQQQVTMTTPAAAPPPPPSQV